MKKHKVQQFVGPFYLFFYVAVIALSFDSFAVKKGNHEMGEQVTNTPVKASALPAGAYIVKVTEADNRVLLFKKCV